MKERKKASEAGEKERQKDRDKEREQKNSLLNLNYDLLQIRLSKECQKLTWNPYSTQSQILQDW
jgi:hypothetical protein